MLITWNHNKNTRISIVGYKTLDSDTGDSWRSLVNSNQELKVTCITVGIKYANEQKGFMSFIILILGGVVIGIALFR